MVVVAFLVECVRPPALDLRGHDGVLVFSFALVWVPRCKSVFIATTTTIIWAVHWTGVDLGRSGWVDVCWDTMMAFLGYQHRRRQHTRALYRRVGGLMI